MVEGIGKDVISDVATNVLRGQLIGYTQRVANHYGIPLHVGVASGPVWDPRHDTWEEGFVDLPIADGNKLLLVPKALVRYRLSYDKDDYHRNYLTPLLQGEELDAGSTLVETLRSGRQRVTKKAIARKYGTSKLAATKLTLTHLEALERYRSERDRGTAPLDHANLDDYTGGGRPDFDALLAAVLTIPSGRDDATGYHRAVEALLSALFYPALVEPVLEYPIHEGRKRIDITSRRPDRPGCLRPRQRSMPRYATWAEQSGRAVL